MAQLPCIGSSWPLTKPPSLWCRYPWTCQGYSLPFCLRKQGALCGGIFARRGPSGFHCRASGMAWWVVFCASEVYGWDMSTTHATLTQERDWETNVEKSWQNPRKDLFWSFWAIWERKTEHLPWNLLAAQDGSNPENQRDSESTPAPKPLLWLKTPKLLLLGKYICMYVYTH